MVVNPKVGLGPGLGRQRIVDRVEIEAEVRGVRGLEGGPEPLEVSGQAAPDHSDQLAGKAVHLGRPAPHDGGEVRRFGRPGRGAVEGIVAGRAVKRNLGTDVKDLLAVALFLGQLAVVESPGVFPGTQLAPLDLEGLGEIAPRNVQHLGGQLGRDTVPHDLEKSPRATGIANLLNHGIRPIAQVDQRNPAADDAARRNRRPIEIHMLQRSALLVSDPREQSPSGACVQSIFDEGRAVRS